MPSCKNCGKEIDGTNKKSFCNSSCAASYNNRKRKHSFETKSKIREGIYRHMGYDKAPPPGSLRMPSNKKINCEVCGSTSPRKYCSDDCKISAQYKKIEANKDSTGVKGLELLRQLTYRQDGKCGDCGLSLWLGHKIQFTLSESSNGSASKIRAICPNCKMIALGKFTKPAEKAQFTEQQLANLKNLYGQDLAFNSISIVHGRRALLGKFQDKTKLSLYSRWLMEGELGVRLDKDQTVDHIDGDSSNDSIMNLKVLSRSENARKGASPKNKKIAIEKIRKKWTEPEYRKKMGERPYTVCAPGAKITTDEVALLRKLFYDRESDISSLMQRFGVSRRQVENILLGVSFSRIPGALSKEEKRRIVLELRRRGK